MPVIKHYDGKKKNAAKTNPKRRPHREVDEVTVEVTEEIEVAAADIIDDTPVINAEAEVITDEAPEHTQDKVHLEFYGSELIRQRAPKVMELADTVAEEWVQDGQFEGLPVGNPLAQVVAAKALRKAKDVEKKLEEKGVFLIAKMGVDYVKAEINKRKK